MRNIGQWPPRGALEGVLDAGGGPTYVKTASAAAVETVLTVLADMDDQPHVRMLVPPAGLTAALETRPEGDGRVSLSDPAIEVRTSRGPVTDTVVVTPEGVTSFSLDVDESVPDSPPSVPDGSPFAASVYAAHGREWKRADPVQAADSAYASG